MSTIERAVGKNNSSEQGSERASRVVALTQKPAQPVSPAGADGWSGDTVNAALGGARKVQALSDGILRQWGLLCPDDDRSRLAEEFRVIKRPILRNAFGSEAGGIENGKLVMVTSALSGEGKSFTSINIALSISREVDRTVLLVDADVARPSVPDYLGLSSDIGLMDLLEDPSLDPGTAILRTNLPNLSVLTAGSYHHRSTELLASDKMARLTEEMADRYPDRLVVFDAPPLLSTSEAAVLAELAGQVVLVVDAERTPEAAVVQSMEVLKRCPVVLTLLNRAPSGLVSGYGYGQYSPDG